MLTSKGSILFKLLANKFCPDRLDQLAAVLPKQALTSLQECPSLPQDAKDPESYLLSKLEWLRSLHYSWLEEPLKTLPESLQNAIASSLPHDMAGALCKTMQTTQQYPEQIQEFLLSYLYHAFLRADPQASDILPKNLLDPSDLDPLLSLSKVELVQLIDLLSMYDLADEIRHVVDRKMLQKVVGRFSQKLQRFLRSCMSSKTKLALSPMHIEKLCSDEKRFYQTLHKRGIQRLCIALAGQSLDFIWHILHILDRGRGGILSKQVQKQPLPTTQTAKIQLFVTLQYMKQTT